MTGVPNVAYTGKIFIPAFGKEDEKLVGGLHQPIVSDELFSEVQEILRGKKRNKIKNVRNAHYVLREFLICGVCGGKVTASGSRSRNGSVHHYYHCLKNVCKQRFRVENTHKEFEKYVSGIEPNQDVLSLYYYVMKDIFGKDENERLIALNRLTGQINEKTKLLEGVQDRYFANEINSNEYHTAQNRYTAQIDELIRERTELSGQDTNFKKYLRYSFGLLKNLNSHYQKASFEVKQRIIGSIFSEKLVFDGKTYRTTKPNELLTLISSDTNGFGGNKKGQAVKINGLSSLAPRLGLEPRTLRLTV